MIELTDRIRRAERYAELCSAPQAQALAAMVIDHWRNGTIPNLPDWTGEGEYPQIAADLWTLLRGEELPPPTGFLDVPRRDRATPVKARDVMKVEPSVRKELNALLFEPEMLNYGYSSFVKRAVQLARAELEQARAEREPFHVEAPPIPDA